MTKDIKKYDFKKGLSQEFEIVDLTELYSQSKDILTDLHRAGFYHIIWFQKGNPTHLVDFNPIKIKPDTLLFINKDTVHQFDSKSKFTGKAILFTDNFFCKTEEDIKVLRNNILFNDLFSVSHIQIGKHTDLFDSIFNQMIDELQHSKDNVQDDILKNLLHNLLLNAERIKRKQNFIEIKKDANLDYVLIFKDLLEVSFRSQKQVNYYTQKMVVTEKRLNQATTKTLGKTPKQIIDDRILLESKRILAHTKENIKEIAYHLGFEEPTNFIKYFKKHCRITPTEFREKNTLA